ncbi:hypothetical protein MNBD_GAMMA26-1118 [hydrothermal vent metagenome]|uniref:Sel1 repeat family protein n=1 Tax=hydrothermal vent metagenome TaxID=652676 RepID=A0A3B1B7B7_9ZZZZ
MSEQQSKDPPHDVTPRHNIPPRGRDSSRWFLFLIFFHLLPFPWYMAVAAGLAPASFLFAAGLAGLFVADGGSLIFAAFLLPSALIAGAIFYLLSRLLAAFIGKLKAPIMRTLSLLLILVIGLLGAMNPIFIMGGHNSSSAFSLYGFADTLAEFGVPAAVTIAYFSGLAFVLLFLLVYQHLVARHNAISMQKWQWQRRLQRKIVLGSLLALILALGWTHRILLVVKPLADMEVASAQYHLAMTIKEKPGARFSSFDYQTWLVRAAEQGHLNAAWQLVLNSRSREEKLRWLKVAAEGEMAEAQYQFYQELLRSSPGIKSSESAYDWLNKAAKNRFPDAQYELGYHYVTGNAGLEIKKNANKARQWLELAADNGQAKAMERLSSYYKRGAQGFPRDPQRAIELLNLLAGSYEEGLNGLPQNLQLASFRRADAKKISVFEERLAHNDPQAQAQLGRELLEISGATMGTLTEAVVMLEKAANQGDSQLQYELGEIFLLGRKGLGIDLPRGHKWWAKALTQNHVKTMERVAQAYTSGRLGYPVDLLKSKALVEKLVDIYRDGLNEIEANPNKARYWRSELKYFDRLFDIAGGNYQSLADLQPKAEAGNVQAQYQLGRQMMVSGGPASWRQGIVWIERAAEGGYAEAQYRLLAYFEHQPGLTRHIPNRGIEFLRAAAEQHHLLAMRNLALAYAKGYYGLARDYGKAKDWYQRLVQAYESGKYLGEIDETFMPTQRQQLIYAETALKAEQEKARRYAATSPLERQIIDVEERYRISYMNAANALIRGPQAEATAADRINLRAELHRLLEESHRLRDAEIERLRGGKL